jgi:hypothetical protein
MTFTVSGNFIRIYIEANELSNDHITLAMPDGYTYKTIVILYTMNISELNSYLYIVSGVDYTFPIVNSSSPSTISLFINNITKPAEIRFIIKEFGQIPDINYFKKAFDPILVTGSDGNEYNVIPSDQFK